MKFLRELLTEITKATYVSAMQTSTDPEGDRGDSEKIVKRAKREQGEKFAKDLEGVAKSHWPKEYGKEGKSVKRGYDKLEYREETRKTKDGKVNKQDVKALKSKIKERR